MSQHKTNISVAEFRCFSLPFPPSKIISWTVRLPGIQILLPDRNDSDYQMLQALRVTKPATKQ